MHKKSLVKGEALRLALAQSLALTRASQSRTIVWNTWMIIYIFARSSTANKPSELQIRQIWTWAYAFDDGTINLCISWTNLDDIWKYRKIYSSGKRKSHLDSHWRWSLDAGNKTADTSDLILKTFFFVLLAVVKNPRKLKFKGAFSQVAR